MAKTEKTAEASVEKADTKSDVTAGKSKKLQTKQTVLTETLKEIRKKFGEGAIMRMGDQSAAQNVPVIPTGILPLDVALGIGGLPRGRIAEVFGPEGTGKTTLALHTVAQAQAVGGVAAYIDAEHALDPRLASALGVNVEDLYLSQPDSGEQALYILESLVRSNAVDIIVVDSVAALTPQAEINGDIVDGAQVGLQARLMSYGLRRLTASISRSNCVVIFINQLRATISTGYGAGRGAPQETTTGGRALKFYTSIRIDVRRGKQITRKDDVIGHELYLKVVKNKLAPPFRTAHASLIYGRGIPLTMAIVDMAIDSEVVKRKGSWLTYKGETLAQGKDNLAEYLDQHADLKAEIREAVLAEASKGLGIYTNPALESSDSVNSDDESAAFQEKNSASRRLGVNLDEEVIDLDIADIAQEDAN